MSQEARIIGRGTWLDKVASEVVERERSLGRDLSLVRVESGLGASGIPHIGSVGDAIRSYGVKLALEGLGYRSELIAFSDDLDGFRKVPSGYPESLNEYLGRPVTRVPDHLGCHSSFGEHVGSLLRSALDRLGIEYTFMSGAEVYKKGLLTQQIKAILDNAELVGRKIRELTGQEKYESVLPYTPICEKCGRLYTTVVTSYDRERGTVGYRCEGAQIRDRYLKGCGFEGERALSEGEGKLVWKGEFAARWAALDIRFEAYGKDIAESVKVNDWICENVLRVPHPHHARYELFQDKGGSKISKSVGNVLTPQEWLSYASPESLRLLMFKRIVGARNLSVEDIPAYMQEFDELEDYYFSGRRDPNAMKDAKQRGIYEYSVLTKVPGRPSVHVPYRLLAELASAAPENAREEFVLRRLVSYGMVREGSPELTARIEWAAEWARRRGRASAAAAAAEPPPVVDREVAEALREFASALGSSKTAEEVQSAAFASLRKYDLQPGAFFSAVYRILLGTERGPRLGPYVMDAGGQVVAGKIEKALVASGS